MTGLGMLGGPDSGRACSPDLVGNVHAEAVCTLVGRRVLAGFPDGRARPDRTVDRGQASTLLGRASGYAVTLPAPASP